MIAAPKLIYSANRFNARGERKFVGGFADRLKGICFTFALSKLVGRDFYIDWDHPFSLGDVLEPNEVSWALPEHVKRSLPGFPTFNLIDEGLSEEVASSIKRDPFDFGARIFEREHPVVLHCNSLGFEVFKSHYSKLSDFGIDASAPDRFFRSIFDTLFSDDKIRGYPRYQAYLDFSLSVATVIGAQFRTGGDGGWDDPELDSAERSELFASSVLNPRRIHTKFD